MKQAKPYLPLKFIYCHKENSRRLSRTKLSTGEVSSHRSYTYKFLKSSVLTHTPGGTLYITGGTSPQQVVCILASRDFAVTYQPPMLQGRKSHASTYFKGKIFVLGGYHHDNISDCEEFSIQDCRWDSIQPLPRACSYSTAIALESLNCMYALGGCNPLSLETIQRYSFESLAWDLMDLVLPYPDISIACYKKDEELLYFIQAAKLFCFNPRSSIEEIKSLPKNLKSTNGESFFSNGKLYCSSEMGPAHTLELSNG
mmetsp:Transcript_11779/g.22774  ORF Transcript_11779/g.22774 Transcript_11779/m.22774 type:complete len:256 (+) Transcript_11779:69-836(+)